MSHVSSVQFFANAFSNWVEKQLNYDSVWDAAVLFVAVAEVLLVIFFERSILEYLFRRIKLGEMTMWIPLGNTVSTVTTFEASDQDGAPLFALTGASWKDNVIVFESRGTIII